MTDAPPPATENGLFSPITLRGVTARNRVVVSPMCQCASIEGGPTDWHMAQLGRYALGGAGIVFGEETAVEARGRKTHHCAGIWDDSHIPQYRRLTDFIRAHGAMPAMQIGHAGRKASVHAAIKDWAPLTEANAEPGHPPWQGLAPSPSAPITTCRGKWIWTTSASSPKTGPGRRGGRSRRDTTYWRYTAPTATCCTSSCHH